MKRILLLTIFFIFLCSQAWATTYFVRDDGNDSNTGLNDAQAWDTIAKVNGFAFNAGDDVYFKCDDTWQERLTVDWAGTSGNHVIIGSYHGNGTIGVSGTRPILDGNSFDVSIVPTIYNALLEIEQVDYVDVKNIIVQNSRGRGLRFNVCDNVTAENIFSNGAWNQSILVYRSNLAGVGTAVVENCQTTNWGYGWKFGGAANWGGSIALTNTRNGTIKYCKVYDGYGEGINLGGQSSSEVTQDCVVEYNVVYDARAVSIFLWNAKNNIVRYNLVYGTGDTICDRYHSATGKYYPGAGIYVCDETSWGHNEGGYVEVYGNLIAWCHMGLYFGFNSTNSRIMYDSVYYNNTIVDCYQGIAMADFSGAFSNCEIKNNIIYDIDDDDTLTTASGQTTSGLTWDYNSWSSAVTGSPDGTNDPVPGVPGLSKTSGWDSLVQNAVDGTDFAIQTGSNCIDAGLDLGIDYTNILNINNSDFTAFTFELRSQGDYGIGWDIGGDIYMTDEEDPPVAGNNDFSEAACIGWWKFEGDATDSKGSDDLGNVGDPTYSAANGDRAVILDGNDALFLANLTGNITGDYTIFAKFKFDAEIGGDALNIVAGEWAVDERCWYLGIKDRTTDESGEDRLAIGVGTNNGDTANHVYDTSCNVPHNTVINAISTYDNTNDDVHGWIYDVDGSNRLDSTDNDGSVADDINNENTEFSVGRLSGGTNYLTGRIYELAILSKEVSEADALKMAQGTYSGLPISVQSATATAGTVSTTGDHSITLVWDREPDITIGVNGPPYFWANAYDGVNYAKYEYVEKSGVNATHTADLTTRMRSTASGAQTQLDFKAGETSIICPDGTTITDMQDLSATLTGLDSLDIDNETYISIPGIFTIGTSGLFPLWSDGSTGFHDELFDINKDKINILNPITDDFAISADNVRIRGTGGNVAITGGITLTGNNTIIKCLTFSSGITDNGNDYVYQEHCRGGIID